MSISQEIERSRLDMANEIYQSSRNPAKAIEVFIDISLNGETEEARARAAHWLRKNVGVCVEPAAASMAPAANQR